jgi:hypothetical protein
VNLGRGVGVGTGAGSLGLVGVTMKVRVSVGAGCGLGDRVFVGVACGAIARASAVKVARTLSGTDMVGVGIPRGSAVQGQHWKRMTKRIADIARRARAFIVLTSPY